MGSPTPTRNFASSMETIVVTTCGKKLKIERDDVAYMLGPKT